MFNPSFELLAAIPLTGNGLLWLAAGLGFAFGVLLHRGGVAKYDVIVNQFRFLDFTVLKIMLTAIVVGGIGVAVLQATGHAQWHVKAADMLAVTLGAAIFGVGMVVYGYCPGTGVAAMASGSIHAVIGGVGMIAGGILYGMTFPWVRDHVLPVASLGKVRLPDYTHTSQWIWLAGLVVLAAVVFALLGVIERRRSVA